MGFFDFNQLDPYQGGLLGALGLNNQAGIAQSYGGFNPGQRQQPEQPNVSDIMNPNIYQGSPQYAQAPQDSWSPGLASFYASLFPSMGNTAQAQPQQQPMPVPPMGGAPQLPPPTNIGPVPQVGGQPWSPAQAQGTPPAAPLNILPPQAADAMAQAQPAPQQQAPQANEPSFGDRLLAGANNFSNPQAGLIARIAGAAQGLSTGQQTAGSKLQETGTDPFTGQKTFAWVNPNNQTMRPATMSGQSSAGGQPAMGQFAEAIRAGVGGQKLMDVAPPEIKNRLQAMLDGREAPPTGAALRNPQTQALINAAHAIDPAFDETKWGVRFAQRKNYEAGGKQFQEAQALNTVSGHLVNLMKSADALDNTPFPIVNGVMNWLRQNTGDPRIDKLNTDVHAVTSELSKAYKAGHVSDSDVRAWNANINSAKSPEQFKSVIGELNDLLRSKRETLDEGYRSAMGATPLPEEYSSQSKRSKGNFDSVSDWSLGGAKPAAPAQVTATGPGGKKLVLQNGQWVPMK